MMRQKLLVTLNQKLLNHILFDRDGNVISQNDGQADIDLTTDETSDIIKNIVYMIQGRLTL